MKLLSSITFLIIFSCVSSVFAINMKLISDVTTTPTSTSYSGDTIGSIINAQQVIDKYITAIGGKEILENVKDRKNVFTGNVQGINLTLEIYQKAPNKYYQKMEAGELNQETWYDGTHGAQATVGRKVPLDEEQLEMMKLQAILNPQLHFNKLGIELEYSGIDSVNGKPAHEIILNLPSGKQWLQYYDVETGYIVKQISSVDSEYGSSTVTSTYSDYRDVQGIMTAHKISQSFGTQMFHLTLESCQINTGLDDELFEVD